MTAHRHTLEFLDVPLLGGRTLRLALERDADGAALWLHLADGWGEAAGWREGKAHGLTLPAECLPDLRAALDALRSG